MNYDNIDSNSIEGKMLFIVREYSPEIYKSKSKFKGLVNDFFANDDIVRLLRKIIDEDGASDVYSIKNYTGEMLANNYQKVLCIIEGKTYISKETLSPAVDLLLLGLGVDCSNLSVNSNSNSNNSYRGCVENESNNLSNNQNQSYDNNQNQSYDNNQNQSYDNNQNQSYDNNQNQSYNNNQNQSYDNNQNQSYNNNYNNNPYHTQPQMRQPTPPPTMRVVQPTPQQRVVQPSQPYYDEPLPPPHRPPHGGGLFDILFSPPPHHRPPRGRGGRGGRR